ncbi:hypothetical protein RHMOL_Rhmol12G0032800 [Rhododendron molle]|uniref:Uncharacterized protein n=1 Tax=Rhododendron molle TaxID=49168 RepID=A0ACC0LE18_RHOML|nr:hypothetical protein RHMOL_Rhmol12G0032800 [Rhododendron molle]
MSNNTSRPYPGGGREDCWSEGATETLVDCYLELNRGNLCQKDWMEVADAINARSNGVKPRRTDVQCKNRVDTIKKKYKLEKSKLPVPSKWRFYSRLDHLIGPTAASAAAAPSKKKTPAPSAAIQKPASTITLSLKSRTKPTPNPNPNAGHPVVVYSRGSSRLNLSGSNESSLGGDRRERREEDADLSEGEAYKELARAILRLGEVYERIESLKQEQMMELEKQRMEFTKELEMQFAI